MASMQSPVAQMNGTETEEKSTVPVTVRTVSNDAVDHPLPRSRKRRASSDAAHEEFKKQRGRPRVEPKDETPADVRSFSF